MYHTSILDCLIDEDPAALNDARKSELQSIIEIRATICRDLENLLNTPRRFLLLPSQLSNLIPSVVDYGMPNFSDKDMSLSNGGEDFLNKLKLIITHYEPRLQGTELYMRDQSSAEEGVFNFYIKGLILIPSKVEPALFSSTFNNTKYIFTIKDDGLFH